MNSKRKEQNVKSVQKWRKSIKSRMVSCMGKCCQICGYDKCNSALEFHHIDPKEKDFTFGKVISTPKNAALLKNELKKCIMLCSNCHREVHEGITEIPKKFQNLDENLFEILTLTKGYTIVNGEKSLKPIKEKKIKKEPVSIEKKDQQRKIFLTNEEFIYKLNSWNGNKSKMALELGVSETAIRKRLKKIKEIDDVT